MRFPTRDLSPRHAVLCLAVAFLVLVTVAVAWMGVSGDIPGADLVAATTETADTPCRGAGSLARVPRRDTDMGPGERVPLPPGLRAAVRSAVEKDAYQIRQGGMHSPVAGSHHAVNRAQRLWFGFSGNGIDVRPQGTDDSTADWKLDMRLCGIGYGDLLQTTSQGRLDPSGNRIDYQRVTATGKSLTEWYVNTPRGLEQGFTLCERPGARRNPEDPLLVEFSVSGNVSPSLAEDRQSIAFGTSDGKQAFRYTGLHAHDARGTELPSHMMVRRERVVLAVDDSAATYPLTIDPLFTTAVKLTADDPGASDGFGKSVAMSGDTALIGTPGDDSVSGSAYVFVRDGTTWSQQAKLTAGDAAPGDIFGVSVAVNGDTALVGAPGDDDGGIASGSAYVFVRTGTTWSQQAKLTAGDAATLDAFGGSVALSGDIALIGALGDDDGGSNSGSAYVFLRNGTSWSETKLNASDAAAGDRFGWSVALSGETALIGADRDNSGSGSAYVFVRSGTVWNQTKLTANDAAPDDLFGWAVALSGDTALVGAPLDDDGGEGSGSAYVFVRNGTVWTQQTKLTASDAAADGIFGSAVAVSGDTVLVGAPGPADESAYVFVRSGTIWAQEPKLTATDGAPDDYFGDAVALSGYTALVSARGDDDNATNSGSAYLYEAGPLTTAVVAAPNPVAVGGMVCLTANVDDTGRGDANIASAEYSLDGGAWISMAAADGMFDEVSEDVKASFSAPTTAGIYSVCVRGTTASGRVGDPMCTLLAVYDPSAGFVSGAGWIDSVAGAYKPNTSLTGKAFFAFVSRYQKGATAPTGNTSFRFRAGDLNFQSSSYDFLVITMGGTNAEFKGSGTVNGNLAPNATPFKFMVWATDNTTDTFRIKIWWENAIGENVVYDNGFNQAIGAGAIKVQAN